MMTWRGASGSRAAPTHHSGVVTAEQRARARAQFFTDSFYGFFPNLVGKALPKPKVSKGNGNAGGGSGGGAAKNGNGQKKKKKP